MNVEKAANQLKDLLVQYLRSVGHTGTMSLDITIEEADRAEPGTLDVQISKLGYGVIVGAPVELKNMTGKQMLPGYLLYEVRTCMSFNRDEPPDVDIIDLGTTRTAVELLAMLGEALAWQAADQLVMSMQDET
jgi:hypothetical protein